MKAKDNLFLWLIAGGLATWRITNILQKEEIASPIRKAAGIIEPDGENPDYWIYPEGFIGKVFHCMYCGSVWVGGAVTIIILLFPPLIIPFVLSALAIVIKDWLEREPAMYIENWWVGGEETEENDEGDNDA